LQAATKGAKKVTPAYELTQKDYLETVAEEITLIMGLKTKVVNSKMTRTSGKEANFTPYNLLSEDSSVFKECVKKAKVLSQSFGEVEAILDKQIKFFFLNLILVNIRLYYATTIVVKLSESLNKISTGINLELSDIFLKPDGKNCFEILFLLHKSDYYSDIFRKLDIFTESFCEKSLDFHLNFKAEYSFKDLNIDLYSLKSEGYYSVKDILDRWKKNPQQIEPTSLAYC